MKVVWQLEMYQKNMSQSPQTGQFNFYDILEQVNTELASMSQSPQTGQFNFYSSYFAYNLSISEISHNPLKRVNSIFIVIVTKSRGFELNNVTIPSNGSIQFL